MLDRHDFTHLQRLLRERSGLALTPDKAYLVVTRTKPIVESRGYADTGELLRRLRNGAPAELVDDVVDAMTTNESLFFRDGAPFEALARTMLPALAAARPPGSPIRIWSAAASTGQEPYSIAIVLEETAGRFPRHPVEILATDLSRAALGRARMGVYTAFEVGRGMPPHYLARYFTEGERSRHTIAERIRARVRFEERNLLRPFAELGMFDIVFCRNVLLYFERPTRTAVLERLARVIRSDGFLVLGGTESTFGLTRAFERHPDWRSVHTLAPAHAETSATSA